LFETIEGGATVGAFLEWFPGVGRDQLIPFWNTPFAVSKRPPDFR
jgi:hypothetical protein